MTFTVHALSAMQMKRTRCLQQWKSEGELSGRDEQPETGGHVTRIFTRAKK